MIRISSARPLDIALRSIHQFFGFGVADLLIIVTSFEHLGYYYGCRAYHPLRLTGATSARQASNTHILQLSRGDRSLGILSSTKDLGCCQSPAPPDAQEGGFYQFRNAADADDANRGERVSGRAPHIQSDPE